MIVKSIIGEGAHAMAEGIGAGAVGAMIALPAKAALLKAKVASGATSVSRPIMQRYQAYQTRKKQTQDLYKL